MVVGLVRYLSFRNGQWAVSTLATQLRQELTTRIQQELKGYFETPHEINRLNAAAMQQGELDVINAQAALPRAATSRKFSKKLPR